MRLLPRLFLSHALVVLLTVVALLVITEALAPTLIQHHVEEMVRLIGPSGRSLRDNLSRGMRNTLTNALLIASAVSLCLAFLAAYLAARRVVVAVRLLSAGSLAIAEGNYQRRLPEDGQDELTELARNFNRMARSLAEVEASRVELINNVAHELRTPLTALQGYAEALNDGVMPPRHASGAILRETRAMERLSNDLSLVSRVEGGDIDLQMTPFGVDLLLCEIRDRFALLAESRRLTLHVEPTGPALSVRADAARTAQVLANLVSNALKYTPAGGRIMVSAGARGDQVAIEVQDDGPGILPADQQRIFERFYRADPSRSRAAGSGGTGVGLTIARGLARAMGGDVVLRPVPAIGPAVGNVFVLSLPLAPEAR